MTRYIPPFLKKIRLAWRERYLVEEIRALDISEWGIDGDSMPWVRLKDGVIFYGMLSTPAEKRIYHQVKNKIKNPVLCEDCFGVVMQIISRYRIPRCIPGESTQYAVRYKPLRDPVNDFDMTAMAKRRVFEFYRPQERQTIVDIGCYMGYGTLQLARAVGSKGRVIACEADPCIFKILEKNIQANGLSNVTLVNTAVSDHRGQATFYRKNATANSLQKSVLLQRGYNDLEAFPVQVTTLDALLNELKIDNVDLVNITVNGSEADVLKGMTQTATRSPGMKITLAGWYRLEDGKKVKDHVQPWLKQKGFAVIVGKRGRVLAWKEAPFTVASLYKTKKTSQVIARIFSLRDKDTRSRVRMLAVNRLFWIARRMRNAFYKWERMCVKVTLRTPVRGILLRFLGKIPGNSGQVRRYLRAGLSVEQFFRILKERNIRYVILRWFEDLPVVRHNEDIDILVADAGLARLNDLFGRDFTQQAFDVYSVSGQRGSDYKKVPYYPPHLAEEILETRIWYKDIYAVPDARLHFLSMAYHVAFHKASLSSATTDHAYDSILKSLTIAAKISYDAENYNDLVKFLQKESWAPQLDTLRILAQYDPWIKKLLPSADLPDPCGQMIVFVIRQWAIDNEKVEQIIRHLKDAFWEIIDIRYLNKEEIKRAAMSIRGNKWDQGPYAQSGGLPAIFVTAFDYHPRQPSAKTVQKYPYLSNENILIKHKIRDSINRMRLITRQANMVHSADDETEALHYLEAVCPQEVQRLKQTATSLRESYVTGYPVLLQYQSNRTRAKIEKIAYKDGVAVKKTFKPGYERYAEREAFVYRTFGEKIPTVPPLLESDYNYIIIPWIDNILAKCTANEREILIKNKGGEIVNTLRAFYDAGYALIGFYDGNLLMTPEGDLKIVDFEFLYSYEVKPESFEQSYDIIGVPPNFMGDKPRNLPVQGHTYTNTWLRLLGPLERYIGKNPNADI